MDKTKSFLNELKDSMGTFKNDLEQFLKPAKYAADEVKPQFKEGQKNFQKLKEK
jgi:hypothetical protein